MIMSQRVALLSLSVLCILVSASCASRGSHTSESGGERAEDDDINTSRTLTVHVDTYNVGLARGFVDYASERQPFIIDALTQHESDLMCLQEVWDQPNIDALISGTQAQFPHNYWVKTERTEINPGCGDEEVAPLVSCIQERCADVSPGELASCGLGQCGMEFDATSPECQTCIASNLGQTIEGIVASCEGGGAAFSSGGHNGLIILSKYPLTQTQHVTLTSTLVQRSALYAQMMIPDYGPLNIVCTHLAADLSGSIQYHGDSFDSFQGEQSAQITEVLGWDALPETEPHLILGDLNSGPETSASRSELPDHFQRFVDQGYRSPYIHPDQTCTFCDQNLLINRTSTRGKIIDHILIKGLEASDMTARRTFDQPQRVSLLDGEERELHLSDHYGVQVTLSLSSTAPND